MMRFLNRSRWARRMLVNSRPNCLPSIHRTIAWSIRKGHLKSERNSDSFNSIPSLTSTHDSTLQTYRRYIQDGRFTLKIIIAKEKHAASMDNSSAPSVL